MDPFAACQEFMNSHNACQIAAQLQRDSNICKAGGRPSFLACLLPTSLTDLADEISKHLHPNNASCNHGNINLPRPVRSLWYNGLIDGIKTYLNHISVLEYLKLDAKAECEVEATATVTNISRKHKPHPRRERNVLCYICRLVNHNPHKLYPSLCEPCGGFNLSSSLSSLPGSLDLRGKIALVTGGRVNLGYSTALRLLRCGAKVIVSSRYPHDAESRYRCENDSRNWSDRLKIVGADFRTSKDAFGLVDAVKKQVNRWSETGVLDILVNNAAQTLTDPVHQEVKAINQEESLGQKVPASGWLLNSQYQARLRGGNGSDWEMSLQWHGDSTFEGSQTALLPVKSHNGLSEEEIGLTDASTPAMRYHSRDVAGLTAKSSWAQSIDEIPYEDLMTAHSVNFFVPLILCRELLPIMGMPKEKNTWFDGVDGQFSDQDTLQQESRNDREMPLEKEQRTRPRGYIINVSSREGIFEDKIGSEAKNGKHVHTNTSKAALNMITETEADSCWRRHKVAMNTVDPGYMSAAPEMQKYGECPITFEDGAARVLWPIATAENEGRAVHGRFFKHFGEVDVNVAAGR